VARVIVRALPAPGLPDAVFLLAQRRRQRALARSAGASGRWRACCNNNWGKVAVMGGRSP